ncbi:MAG: MoaD/ThiS family protein [Anaerolineae bacterium]
MNVYLRLYGPLRDRLPKENKGGAVLKLEEGTTVAQALASVGIDWTEILWAISEQHDTDAERPLEDGDELAVFTHVAGG